jgi:hypothetical protein
MSPREWPALPVVAALVLLLGITALVPSADVAAGPADDLPVEQAQLVCPALDASLPGAVTALDAAPSEPAAPVVPGEQTGSLTASALGAPPGTPPVATATDLGRPLVVALAGSDLLVDAAGPAAAGLVASHLEAQPEGASRALAGGSCAAAAVQAWYVGGGAAVGQRSTLFLANAEAAPATVEVAAWSEAGPVSPDRPTIVTVPARGRSEVALDGLAPGAARVAVSVRAVTGRVSSSVLDRRVEGTAPRGADWIAPGALARTLVVGPLPAGEGGSRLLQITVPGDRDAVVQVRVVTPDGAFAPAGGEVLEVPAGTVAEVDATAFAEGREVAIELASDVPIAATARLVRPGDGGIIEEAFVAGVRPAEEPGSLAVAEARSAPDIVSTLLVAAVQADFRGTLRLIPADPALPASSAPVEVAAGTTAAIPLSPPAPGSFSLVLEPAPGSGPAEAVRSVVWALAKGPAITTQRLDRVVTAVAAPRTAPDLGAGLPGH